MADDGEKKDYRKWVGGGAAVVLLLFLGIRGCSGDETVTLTGKVAAKDGRPVTWGTVTVVASDNKVYTAPIRPDGTYQIVVPPGPFRSAITSPDPQHYLGAPAPGSGGADAGGDGGPGAAGGGSGNGGGGGGKQTVRVTGGGSGNGGGGTGGGWGSTTTGGTAGGGGGGGANRNDKKQVFGAAPTVAPPQTSAPANLPPRRQWFPIPGRYGNPNTSGFSSQVGPGGGSFDITVD